MSAQDNVRLWEEHLKGEFVTKDENLSLSTLVELRRSGTSNKRSIFCRRR
ncbi:MAG: hypothetical protein HYZ72_01020 [Deltaproteobacteria bacterium]|nr:hypothetical protein [Deltaproteobacteria bacterium]